MKINSTQPNFNGGIYFNPKAMKSPYEKISLNAILKNSSDAEMTVTTKRGDIALFFAKGRESLEEKIADLFKGFKGIKIVHRPDINEEAHFLAATPAIFKKLNEVVK